MKGIFGIPSTLMEWMLMDSVQCFTIYLLVAVLLSGYVQMFRGLFLLLFDYYFVVVVVVCDAT